MGNGYLGKISAIVTANTGDFKPKLDAAAGDVKRFASGVESTLRSASTGSAKAMAGIYTPLQRIERAMQAAYTMKLSFKGFDGVIKDVDGLKVRLASLGKRQIDISVTGTAFKTMKELQDIVRNLSTADVEWVRSLGGLRSARELVPAMKPDEQARLSKFDKVSSLNDIDNAVSAVSKQQFVAATRQMKMNVSAAEEIFKPMGAAVDTLASKLSLDLQAKLHPALKATQKELAKLGTAMDSGASNVGAKFDRARQAYERFNAVVEKHSQITSMVGSMENGKGLRFTSPATFDAIAEANAAQRRAGQLSATAAAKAGASGFAARQLAAANALNMAEAAADQIRARRRIAESRSGATPERLSKYDTKLSSADADVARKQAALKAITAEMIRQLDIEEKRSKVPKTASDIFGPSLGSAKAKSNDLESTIKSLQSSIAQLPVPLQAKFIPALERARAAFVALGDSPTDEALAKASQQAANLERNLKRAQTAMRFDGSFKSFIDDSAADRFLMQLNAVRQGMISVGATASGPVAAAIDEYQRALASAGAAGTLGTEDTKKQMDELLQKIAQVAVATKQMTAKQAQSFVQMVQHSGKGDISRTGMSNFNLAMQQGAFALDDFMSSTGGIEFKLRAVSNNLTQMAFILGSTKGLWIAVGAVMATTIGIPLMKAIFDFAKFENQNKALNDELSRSKSIAERTAEAYKELGKSIREAGVGGGGKAAAFVDDRRRDASDRSESAVLQRSRAFSEAQSRVITLEKALEGESDIGTRGTILRQLDEARKQRDAVKERGIAPPSIDQVNADLDGARMAEIALRRSSRSNWEATDAFSRRRAAIAAAEGGANVQGQEEAIAALDKQIANLGGAIKSSNFFERVRADYVPEMSSEARGTTNIRRAREQIAKLEEERARIQEDISLRRNERFMPRAMAAAAAAELTPQYRDSVSGLGLGSNVTARFMSDIEVVSKNYGETITALEKAVRNGDDTTALEIAADKSAKALEYLYQEADRLATGVALGAIVPTKERLDRAAEQLSGIGPSAIATDIARAQARRETLESERRRAEMRGDEFGVNAADYELERIDNLTKKLESAAVVVESFQKAVENAALSLSRTLVQEAQSREAELRRAANRYAGQPGFADAADDAAAEARRQEDRDRRLNQRLRDERIKFEEDKATDPELKALADRVVAGKAAAENKEKSAREQAAGATDAENAQAELDRRLEQRTKAARAEVDAADAAAAKERDRVAKANEQRRGAMGGVERLAQGGLSAITSSAFAMPVGLDRAASLVEEARELGQRVGEAIAAGIESPFDAEVEALREKVDEFNESLTSGLVRQANMREHSVEGLIASSREELRGVGQSDLQGKMNEMEVRKRRLEEQRDAALSEGTPEGRERAVAISEEIAGMSALAEELAAAAVAVGGFQEAMRNAAMALQDTLFGEASGRANDARRSANEAAAVFGAGSPEARRERQKQERAEAAMRRAETERREAEDAIARERIKFEQEIEDGTDPASAERAKKIKELELTATDQNLGAEERADAAAESRRLREEQRREFENRPEVQAQRERADAADAEMARRQSVERGLEMGRTADDRRREDVRRQAGDLRNAADFLRNNGRGNEIRGLAQNAAMNMAGDAAPLYAQLTEEVMNARLQGPSRAALNASDIATSQGASELNRLLRGDDSAKNVNLAELKKQSNLLERIERAVLDSTGVVVNL